MIYEALDLARGWLAVAQASAKDGDRPALSNTVHVEEFDGRGLQLVATDSYMMLHAWVPSTDDPYGKPPELDELPDATFTVIDGHGRGKSLMKHALKIGKAAQTAEDAELAIRVTPGELAAAETSAFPGMEPKVVTFRQMPHPLANGEEKLSLPLYDGEWPDWRAILKPREIVRTEVIALAPDILSRLAGVGQYHSGARIGLMFTGVKSPVLVEVLESDPYVSGVAMPVKWDFAEDVPRDMTQEEFENIVAANWGDDEAADDGGDDGAA